jgi:uncharacterized repeat protein (TIGR01451 family)
MKKLFSHLPKKVLITLAGVFAVIGIAVGVQAAFGPNRPTYTMANPADHITFNSITDNPIIGDERYFLKGALPGAADFTDPVTNVTDGQEITLLMFVHNDAAAELDLVAKNTTVKIAIPQGSKQGQQITGYVSANNAQPTEVWDTLDISGGNNEYFELEYVAGSAKWKNNHFTGDGITLPDSIVTTGALVGNTSLNGEIPGCAEFSGWVTLKVKVNMPHYTILKQSRLAGEGADKWRDSVTAKVGDTVEWRMEIRNVGSTALNHMVVLDQLPANTEVVPGSVQLINSAYPPANPYTYPDADAIQYNNGKTWINVDGGNYYPNSSFYIRFKAKIVDDGSIECGETALKNIAWVTPEGYGSISSYTNLTVIKPCDQPVYSCDNLNVTAYEDRSIEANIETTELNGAVFKDMNIDFGDGSESFVTDGKTADYAYDEDGTYTIRATAGFMVDSEYKTDNGPQCTKTVTFEGGEPVEPEYPEEMPGELPVTGAGSVAGIFAATSALGAIGYRFWAIRRR